MNQMSGGHMRILVAVLALGSLVASAQAPVGLLSSVKGTVQIVRAGKTTPDTARPADLIGAEDRLITGANGEAVFLYCPDPKSARLMGGGEAVFGASALQVKKGKLSDERKVGGCRLPTTLALSGASQQQVGLVRTRGGDVNLRSPTRSFIDNTRPKFRWLPVDGAKSYDFRVTDREEKTLFQTTVATTEVEYPADAAKLVPGQKYWWRVTARGADDTLAEAGTFFQTLNEKQAVEFRAAEADLKKQVAATPADNGPLILLAFLYEENGLLENAALTYDDLMHRLGSNDWLITQRNTALNRLGWNEQELERLRKK